MTTATALAPPAPPASACPAWCTSGTDCTGVHISETFIDDRYLPPLSLSDAGQLARNILDLVAVVRAD